ncbi:MAG TPA: alpha/beta hydrolase [Candidatus Acidoferrum sp.]|nr:alpha/beta hydrolase [Candidatus Acidoferrum sp.]
MRSSYAAVPIRQRMLRLLIYALIGYMLMLLLVRIFETRLVFFPDYSNRLAGDWHPQNLAVQDIWLTSADGTKLHAWWIANEKAKFTFLAFHGNAGNIADRAPIYEFLRDAPGNVLALEYRGYGHSEGKPSEAGIYRDAEAGYQYLINVEHIDPHSIISFGQSLGTAVAAHLAAQHQVGAVILEAPFPSASRLAKVIFRFLPGSSLLVRGQFDTQARLQEIRVPILIVHCRQDPVLPFELGQEVYATANEPKAFLEINGSCHEEASIIAPEKYRTALQNFLGGVGRW